MSGLLPTPPTRSAPPTSIARPRRNRAARALALLVALVVLFVSLSAEAKKKKPAKKGKTPTSKSKGQGKEAAPEPESETDSASSDEKSSNKDEGDEKAAAKAPPSPPPEDEEMAAKKPAKPAKASPQPESEEAAGGAPIAFRFGVGGKALFRNLSWTDDMGALAPYSLSPGPEAAVWLEAFPAAFATDGFAANIGLFGHFNYGFRASSKTPAGATLDTKYQDFLVGLKIRFPVGMFIPYVAGGYGMQKFHLEPADATRPNFNYSLVSAGAGTRIEFTPAIDLDVGASYLFVTNPGSSAGEVAAPGLYPNATAYGVDASLSLGFRVMSAVGLRAGVDFRQIGLATHWKTGDTALRAGGALDRYIAAWGGLEVVFDGVGGGAGGGESEQAAPAKKAAPKPKKPAGEDGEPEAGSED
jgi:hypothetical protein